MLYPKFLDNYDKLGVVALSSGVGESNENFDLSIENIKKYRLDVVEADSVRVDGDVSNTAEERVNELNKMISDNDIKLILCACGGDFLYEILPYVDLNLIKHNVKWYMGYSDPSSLLYLITTKLDIATIYGFNAGSFDSKELHESQDIAIRFMKGEIVDQESYSMYESSNNCRIDGNYNFDSNAFWETLDDEPIDIEGRIIGGCIDCLRYLPGTRFDNTTNFVEKYKEDGIIWYFDIFNMSSEDFYLTLLQLKEIGWFRYIKGVIVGRVFIPNTYTSVDYMTALSKVFVDVPVIFNADIGHVVPKMTIINGCYARLKCSDGTGRLFQSLE